MQPTSGQDISSVSEFSPGTGATDFFSPLTVLAALRHAYFDEVGESPASVLYQTGMRSAYLWAWDLPVDDSSPAEWLQRGIQLLVDQGLGAVSVEEIDSAMPIAFVRLEEGAEAAAWTQRHPALPTSALHTTSGPSCHFTSGALAGLWTMAAQRFHLPGSSPVCREVACITMGAPACRFAIGQRDDLLKAGIDPVRSHRAVRWELAALARRLDQSTRFLDDLSDQLARREGAYQSLLDNMNDVLVVIDREKHVVFCNQRYLEATGLTREQALGQTPLIHVIPDDRDAVEAAYDNLLSGLRESATYRCRARRGNQVVILESSARGLIDPSGERLVEILARDVTDREEARQKLEKAHKDLVKQQRQADDDLRVAKTIHETLLPRPVDDPYVFIDVRYVPLGRVGGDYCHIASHDHRHLLTLFDVSGHGVAAALLAARVHGILRASETAPLDPLKTITDLNAFLRRSFPDTRLFLTAFSMLIDGPARRVTHCGAGHPPALLWRKKTGLVERLDSQNLPAGLVEDFLRDRPVRTTEVAAGDRLLLYTDGVTETLTAARDQLSVAGLAQWLGDLAEVPIHRLADALFDRLSRFRAAPAGDDITLMPIEIR